MGISYNPTPVEERRKRPQSQVPTNAAASPLRLGASGPAQRPPQMGAPQALPSASGRSASLMADGGLGGGGGGSNTPSPTPPLQSAPPGSTNTTTAPPPAPTPPPAVPPVNTPGVGAAPINPSESFRGASILPSVSERMSTAQGQANTAAAGVSNFNTAQSVDQYGQKFGQQLATAPVAFKSVGTDLSAGAAVNPEDSAALTQFRDMRSEAASGLTSGPSRSQIAMDKLAAFDARNQQGVKDLQRQIIQRSAAAGRLGMGDDQVASLRPFTDYLTQRGALEKELAAETAEGEISDRYNLLDASRGLVGEEEAIGAGRRGELRGERDYATEIADINVGRRIGERDAELGLAERNAGRDFDARRAALDLAAGVSGQDFASRVGGLGALSGFEQGIGQDEADFREEYRGERDYEQFLSRQALEDALRERGYADERGDVNWSRDMAEDTLAAGINPAGVFLGAGGQYGANAAAGYGGAGGAFAQWLARRNAGG